MGLGALVSSSNPYFLLWWATIGSAYLVSAALYGFPGIAAFVVGHILADLTWFSLIAYATAYGRRLLTLRAYRGLISVRRGAGGRRGLLHGARRPGAVRLACRALTKETLSY